MKRNICTRFVVPWLAAVLMTAAGGASAQVELFWSPDDTVMVAPGDTTRLAIRISDVLNFRTAEITVQYDTTVVRSLGGGSGTLFTESGIFVVDGFEEEPGSWHGFAVLMGAGEHLTGPGELLYWEVEGLVDGVCPVTSVEVLLYDEASPPNLIPEVSLDNATILVQDPLSYICPSAAVANKLQVSPNPFNPKTRISFEVLEDTWTRLSVFDLRGRQVAVLQDGPTAAGTFSTFWNGTDDSGRSQPGGMYVFRLDSSGGTVLSKGILVK